MMLIPRGGILPPKAEAVNEARKAPWQIRRGERLVAKPYEVTDANFETEVLKSDKPVLVDFWAPWCGPCRMVAPIVDELSDEYDGKVKFVKLNTDDNVRTASTYGIRSIPTLLVFKGGQPVGQIIGFRPKSDLKQRLDAVV
jgi:thioredoxin 1